ncbi:MAG: metalloregulator ArsR/SmtB family transcription factor [bacterium]|nr:metalloregulator ArsR/SmtB family transcription factor [bacterium]
MKELERTLKALANKRRLAIIKYLKARQSSFVGDIASEINLSFKATSRHLAVLGAVDIVEKNQQSSRMFYRLADKQIPAAKNIISLL